MLRVKVCGGRKRDETGKANIKEKKKKTESSIIK